MKISNNSFLTGNYEYDIIYAINPRYEPSILSLVNGSHKYLFTIQADSLEDAFWKMQGENWSPNGEGRKYIEELGLKHTSMSVNDIIASDDGAWIVKDIGFEQIHR